jgi:hypothetical protein
MGIYGVGGGGIYSAGSLVSVVVRHSTLADNISIETWDQTYYLPGIRWSGKMDIKNSIVSGQPGTVLSGVLTSSGHNLISDSTGGSGYAPTDILDVDPMLGPLTDNGGPTLTHALLPGSPAIDAGDNTGAPEWDQRGPGFPRIVNGTVDIGAFEVQGMATPIPELAAMSSAVRASEPPTISPNQLQRFFNHVERRSGAAETAGVDLEAIESGRVAQQSRHFVGKRSDVVDLDRGAIFEQKIAVAAFLAGDGIDDHHDGAAR